MTRTATILLFLAPALRADSPIDSEFDRDPPLPAPREVKAFPRGIAEAWVRALGRPEIETKVLAAQSIALAHRQGLTGLDQTVGPLMVELDRPGQHPTVRLAVAQALVALDARSAADRLFRQLATDDPELLNLVEPALAKWDYKPVRAVWLDRLGKGPPYHRRHLLAVRGLGEVREEKAAPVLRDLARSATVPVGVRVEAARALATVRPAGLEPDAAALAADGTPPGMTGRLVAASLLRRHQGDEAVRLLQGLARDPEPAVAAVALARLVEIDAKLVVPLLEPVLASPDANVRGIGVETLFRQPTLAHVRRLGDRLADPHPAIRDRARVALHELAGKAEFRGPVVRAATDVLAEDDWRGQEQAAVLLAQLGHRPAAGRLVELLPVDRPEAMVAVGWALRRLAVPDTLPAVLAFVERDRKATLAAVRAGNFTLPTGRDPQVAQLVQFLAQTRHRAAEPLFREMVPRILPRVPASVPTPPGPESRAAAVWGLGLFHEGAAVPDLVTAFQARLNDVPSPAGAEDDRVRRAAAISLGRMKATAAVPALRRFYTGKPTLDPVTNACGWALERITGERVPPPGVIERMDRAWFLSPLD